MLAWLHHFHLAILFYLNLKANRFLPREQSWNYRAPDGACPASQASQLPRPVQSIWEKKSFSGTSEVVPVQLVACLLNWIWDMLLCILFSSIFIRGIRLVRSRSLEVQTRFHARALARGAGFFGCAACGTVAPGTLSSYMSKLHWYAGS